MAQVFVHGQSLCWSILSTTHHYTIPALEATYNEATKRQAFCRIYRIGQTEEQEGIGYFLGERHIKSTMNGWCLQRGKQAWKKSGWIGFGFM